MEKEKLITIVLVIVIVLAVATIFMNFNLDGDNSSGVDDQSTAENQGTIKFTIEETPQNTGGSSSSGGINE